MTPTAASIADPKELLGTRPGDSTFCDRYGITKVVYSLVYPETRAILDALWGARPHTLFERAYLDLQDGAEEVFIDRWAGWAEPVVGDLSSFGWRYATAGSTEAIRESIWMHARQARERGIEPRIHVFEGEYEGYAAYAAAAGVSVTSHPREHWRESLNRQGLEGDRWYVSQPSAIDGDAWRDFDEWLDALAAVAPQCRVMLDATYVGAARGLAPIRASHSSIDAVFFSLSKVFGVYYHRIGGCVSRREMPGLYGSRWFKNMFSLHLGHALLGRLGVHDLARRYAATQAEACARISKRIGAPGVVQPSDAVMLGQVRAGDVCAMPSELQPLRRGAGYRLCLTPMMTELLASSPEPS